MKIAVASTDGKMINQHFGHADRFMIFELSGSAVQFVEIRRCPPLCGASDQPGHSDEVMEERMRLIGDCGAVLCARIGYGMQRELAARRIRPVEVAGFIEDVLHRLLEGAQRK
ncbi:MAG: dinitrogenase iron-molybdenum cofactor biosynthesis protein [Nitrospinae bacterium]|nr:dinitrogenase iron-molybdenum cofactor biosynthesis protein [Nitrospinota bacterium]